MEVSGLVGSAAGPSGGLPSAFAEPSIQAPAASHPEAGSSQHVQQLAVPAVPDLRALKAKLRMAAMVLTPAIYKRGTGEAAFLQEMGIHVADWASIRMGKAFPLRPLQSAVHPARNGRGRGRGGQDRAGGSGQGSGPGAPGLNPAPKLTRVLKSKANGAGRQYTSKFRGVHQTFPTRRWEAQFRRNGKPTSLGCFDHEEEAARAYDKMMLWCELHNAGGVKGGVTNYDPSEYEADIPLLQAITQDELIEQLRGDGRKQAAQRQLRHKREYIAGGSGGGGTTARSGSRAHASRETSEAGGSVDGTGGGGGASRRRESSVGDGSLMDVDGQGMLLGGQEDPDTQSGSMAQTAGGPPELQLPSQVQPQLTPKLEPLEEPAALLLQPL